MQTILLQLLTAFLGSLGFALLFGLHRQSLLPASLGGLLAWGVYLLTEALLHSAFLAALIASVLSLLYAELMARLQKKPATLFVVPAIIPLVPGSSLYYAMSSAVRGEMGQARAYGSQTLLTALAIAAGISLVIALRELRTRR